MDAAISVMTGNTNPLATAGTQVFPGPGAGLTPEQQEQLRRNRERLRASRVVAQEPSKVYGYIFTKNYIILAAILVTISVLLFSSIIAIEMSGNSNASNKPLNARFK